MNAKLTREAKNDFEKCLQYEYLIIIQQIGFQKIYQ